MEKANEQANKTLEKVKRAIGVNYFNDDTFLKEIKEKYQLNR